MAATVLAIDERCKTGLVTAANSWRGSSIGKAERSQPLTLIGGLW